MTSGNKPLPEPVLIQIYVAIQHHSATMSYAIIQPNVITTCRLEQNDGHFAEDILKCILLKEIKSVLVQVMGWCYQAGGHWLNQCRSRSASLYSISQPNLIDPFKLNFLENIETYLHQDHGWWQPADTRSQAISSHGIDVVFLEYSWSRTVRVNMVKDIYI